MDSEYNSESYYLTLDCGHNRVFVNLLSEQQNDDNPPSYEMALLCPTVQLSQSLDNAKEDDFALNLDKKDIK